MSTSSSELYRNCLLNALAAALPASLSTETLLLGQRTAGFQTSPQALSSELLYLMQKGFLELVVKPLDPAPRYRLSASGRDYLQTEGLL